MVTVAAAARSATGSARSRSARCGRSPCWKGHVGGYGRAAVSNAIAIVWSPESKKSPTRPRLGKEGGGASPGEFRLAGARVDGTFARAISCVTATTNDDDEEKVMNESYNPQPARRLRRRPRPAGRRRAAAAPSR